MCHSKEITSISLKFFCAKCAYVISKFGQLKPIYSKSKCMCVKVQLFLNTPKIKRFRRKTRKSHSSADEMLLISLMNVIKLLLLFTIYIIISSETHTIPSHSFQSFIPSTLLDCRAIFLIENFILYTIAIAFCILYVSFYCIARFPLFISINQC